MILAENLIKTLKKNNIDFYTGVPDSILKKFSTCLDKLPKKNHIVSTNEGSSVATGIGYYLSTKKIACVYLQNSGLSNAINPLLSIASSDVYSIPLLLIIGWRGSPGMKDEPQHVAKGKITKKILKLLKIDFCLLRKPNDLQQLKKLINNSYKKNKIVACLIEKGTLNSNIKLKKQKNQKNQILRSEFIKEFLKNIPKNSKIVSTTGYTSRELMQLRQAEKLYNGEDFYMVGGMGHSAMVALGYSFKSNKEIFCLDGDGSILMHLGSLRTAGHNNSTKFKHILLNNGTHESVGGQSTTAAGIDFKNLIKSIGYKNYFQIKRKNKIKTELKKFIKSKGPSFLEVKIKNGTMKNLTRPKNLIYIKNKFMSK